MQPRAADDPERVSFHAVARYVQRILHIDVSEEFETEKARAQAHAAAAGMSIDEVRALIWTKGLSTAAQFGLTSFDNHHFAARIAQPGGVVVTIFTPRCRGNGKLRVLSDKELKQKAHRLNRRASARRDTLQSLEGADS